MIIWTNAAKKTLNKMDSLAKLHHFMLKVADEVAKERAAVRSELTSVLLEID